MEKASWILKQIASSHILRYGLVVRIPGSHPGGPGSIPGNGIFSFVSLIKCRLKETNKKYSHAGS